MPATQQRPSMSLPGQAGTHVTGEEMDFSKETLVRCWLSGPEEAVQARPISDVSQPWMSFRLDGVSRPCDWPRRGIRAVFHSQTPSLHAFRVAGEPDGRDNRPGLSPSPTQTHLPPPPHPDPRAPPPNAPHHPRPNSVL